jgi:hypothetical protein
MQTLDHVVFEMLLLSCRGKHIFIGSMYSMNLIEQYACPFVNLQCILLQYGRILDIDLKIPPRPPGYAFVEVRIFSYSYTIARKSLY